MSKIQDRRKQQVMLARMEIVSQLYLRGNSIRKIRAEVMRRLNLPTYSTKTVHNDIQRLLKEWHESRLHNIDDAVQLELTRIDETVVELWEQWEKSKLDYTKTTRKRKGAPVRNPNPQGGDQSQSIRTVNTEETTIDVQGLGDPSYIAEIRQQLSERRKLLGLYSAEKREIKTIGEQLNRDELESELRRLRLLTDDNSPSLP